jgi:antitoxin YefM
VGVALQQAFAGIALDVGIKPQPLFLIQQIGDQALALGGILDLVLGLAKHQAEQAALLASPGSVAHGDLPHAVDPLDEQPQARQPTGHPRPEESGTLSRTARSNPMATVSATEARRRLYALIDEVSASHEPVQITGKRGNAVLLAEEDWRAIQETLHLVSSPGLRESILEGMATDASELSSEPGW